MRYAAIALTLSGCAEPVIDMHLVLPPSSTPAVFQDTSCVSAVEVHVIGKNYPRDPSDLTVNCLEVTAATYPDIANAIRGKFDLKIPAGGFAGVEMFGWSGTMPCAMQQPYTTPDLAFFSNAQYAGADQIDLKLQPNVACQRATVNVRLVDMLALVSGATPSSANCTAAAVADNLAGPPGAGSGTIVPQLFEKEAAWFGNYEGANQTNGLSTFDTPIQTGAKSCFALDAGYANGGSTGCVVGGTPVCANAGEIETPIIPDAIVQASVDIDSSVTNMFPGIVIGEVWSNTAPKKPIAGATVQIDPSQGVVDYVDPTFDAQGNATGLTKHAGSSTGATGMFIVYTNTLAQVTVTAGASSRMVTLSSPFDRDGAALVVMP